MGRSIRLFLVACLLSVGYTPAFGENSISKLTEGPPELLGSILPEESYVKVTGQKLAKARVLWINYALLREMGIDVPPGGMTPEFEQEILDALAYAVPRESDPPGTFEAKFMEFFSDRYGGNALNGNLGSGRAASRGGVQHKGYGVTPNVGPKVEDRGHAHGGASTTEGVQEAIWGEVLHREMPHGANRVVAILSTGTVTEHEGWDEKRSLIVRVDPLRPAHFLSNHSMEGEQALALDQARVEGALANLTKALPGLPGKQASEKERIKHGLETLTRRTAESYATAYARRFYHGATSPSNFMMNGGFIDYGTQTALPDFQRLLLLKDDGPNGDSSIPKRDLLNEIVDDFAQKLPVSLRGAVPSRERVSELFDEAYGNHLGFEMLRLTGAPEELLKVVQKTLAGKALIAEMLKVASEGQPEVIEPKGETLVRRGKYDLGAILTTLAAGKPSEIPLVHYEAFLKVLRAEALPAGVSLDGLQVFMKAAAVNRNRNQPDLYIGNKRWEHINAIIDKSVKKEKPHIIQNYIDGVIAHTLRDIKDDVPFRVVLEHQQDPVTGVSRRRVFDARQNTESEILRVPIQDGHASVFGTRISLEQLKETSLSYRMAPGEKIRQTKAVVKEGHVEFEVPAREGAHPAQFIALRRPDGGILLRAGRPLTKPFRGAMPCPYDEVAAN